MLFNTTLYIALIIFGIGVIYKAATWFWKVVGVGPKTASPGARIGSAIVGILGSIFSPKIGSLIVTFIVDVIFQFRILKDKTGRIVWVFHVLIFLGFMGLFFMHGLDGFLADYLFENYQSTLNPFMFLRNLFGLMVVVGLVIALLRRFVFEKDKIKTKAGDIFAIVLILLIMCTGFILESIKINSYADYQRMVEEYSSAEEPEEIRALEAYWVEHFGVVSPNDLGTITDDMLTMGEEWHNDDCAECHTKPTAAFISYPISRAIKPGDAGTEESGAQKFLYIFHYIVCFLGLAYMPFSKMFHIITTPLSLLVAAGTKKKDEEHANVPTRQMIELAGCSHGGSCHEECPVRVKREERIELNPQFNSAVEFLETADYESLGSRKFVK